MKNLVNFKLLKSELDLFFLRLDEVKHVIYQVVQELLGRDEWVYVRVYEVEMLARASGSADLETLPQVGELGDRRLDRLSELVRETQVEPHVAFVRVGDHILDYLFAEPLYD